MAKRTPPERDPWDDYRQNPGGLPADLVRALEWLRTHLNEPVQLEALAAAAGVRPRTLERHFRSFLRTTPLGWVRRMRLSLARQRLLHGRDEPTVTGIALASGFNQLGRFAEQYRKRFGELPSQTLKAAQRKDADVDDEAVCLTLRALESAHAVAPRECDAALEDLARARKVAPAYQLPKALEAWCLGQRAAQHFSATPIEDAALARRLAEEASAKAPNDVMVLTHCSGALALAHRIEDADKLAERALALDPWSALGWYRRGWISAYLGDAEGALRDLNTALHIMPFWPLKHT